MAYDEALATHVRKLLARRKNIVERKMFGGLAFMLDGNMCCGVLDKKLVLRLGEEKSSQALRQKHVEPMDFTGKPMKTMVYVRPNGVQSEAELRAWINVALKFGATLPSKTLSSKPPTKRKRASRSPAPPAHSSGA